MESYGVQEARTILGELVERVRMHGETFLITRYDKPVAVLVPLDWYTQAKAVLTDLQDYQDSMREGTAP